MNPPDSIEIRRLRVSTFIGVPDSERSTAQEVSVTVRMIPSQGFAGLSDDISRTIDYYAVALEIEEIAAARPRKLIETLAADIANALLLGHPLSGVAITIEKFILPNTKCVAVHLERHR